MFRIELLDAKEELFNASKSGNVEKVNELLEKGVNPNYKNKTKKTPLHVAAEKGHIQVVKQLLSNGADLTMEDWAKRTPLHFACLHGHLEVVDFILCDYRTEIENTIREYAVASGINASRKFSSTLGKLKKIDKSLLSKDKDGQTPFQIAASKGYIEIVELYLEIGFSLETIEFKIDTPLFEMQIGTVRGANSWLDGGILFIPNRVTTPLHAACASGQRQVVSKLLEYPNSHNIEAKNEKGETPLQITIERRDLTLAKMLLRHNAKLDEKSLLKLLDIYSDYQRITKPKLSKKFSVSMFELAIHTNTIEPLTIDLTGKISTTNELKQLSTILKPNKSIAKLILAKNSFSHNDMLALSEALKTNKALRILDLSSISFRDKSGLQYIFSSLVHNTGLIKLNLKGCFLDQADIKALLQMLKKRAQTLTLQQIELEQDVLDKLSSDEKNLLPNSNINEELILASPKSDRTTLFKDIVKQIELRLLTYKKEEWSELKNKLFQKKSVPVSELSMDEIKIWITHEMTIWIKEYASQFSPQEDDPEEQNIQFITALLTRYMECVDIISDQNHSSELISWLADIQKMIEHAQQTAIGEWIKKYEEKYSDIEQQTSDDIFRESFQLKMVELMTVGLALGSGHVQPVEIHSIKNDLFKTGKHIILALPAIGTIANSSLHLFKTTAHIGSVLGSTLKRVIEFVEDHEEQLEALSKIVEHLSEIPAVEHAVNALKEKVIRKIHGLAEKEKLRNLVACFSKSDYLSEIQSLAFVIAHHYQEQIKDLTPALAKLWGEYVYLHVADLFMSGAIQGKTSAKEAPLKRLSIEELAEEAVLWLSYVSPRHRAPKVKIKDKKVPLTEHFLSPTIRFKDQQDNVYTCNFIVKTKKNKLISKKDNYPPRWATQKEVLALTKLWDSEANKHQTLPSKTRTNHVVIFFHEAQILTLDTINIPLRTEKCPHQSYPQKLEEAEKLIKHQGKIIARQENEIIQLKKAQISQRKQLRQQRHQSNVMDGYMRSNKENDYTQFEKRFNAARAIQFWYRRTRDENMVLKMIEDKKPSLVAEKIEERRAKCLKKT